MNLPHSANKSIAVKLTFEFSLDIMHLCSQLDQGYKYSYSKQLFRSGTGIGANVIEAQNAESKKDFLHKIKIAAKEAEETEYWLLLGNQSEEYPDMKDYLDKLYAIKRVLNGIISTTKANL